ncbi:hypothetical protein Glove_707g5 [Diversispora epigaea]|uniref:Uncharacterized protein n=1 Tax=Diversispora epigaea TaxID=1348612 RepID=A0A397G9Y7_9GLOM|nr:hypothetical protein Glove_707g5 [Diversispora epigaea]
MKLLVGYNVDSNPDENVSEDWWKKISISSTKNNISSEQMVESTNNNNNINIINDNNDNNNHMSVETTDLSSSHDTQFEGSFSDGSHASYQPSSLRPSHEIFKINKNVIQ